MNFQNLSEKDRRLDEYEGSKSLSPTANQDHNLNAGYDSKNFKEIGVALNQKSCYKQYIKSA
jgi:hypothetical protein